MPRKSLDQKVSVDKDALIFEDKDAVFVTNITTGYTHRLLKHDLGLSGNDVEFERRVQEMIDARIDEELERNRQFDDLDDLFEDPSVTV